MICDGFRHGSHLRYLFCSSINIVSFYERNAMAQKKNPIGSHFVCEEKRIVYEATKGSAECCHKKYANTCDG
nr:MAG TPA: hypothetical protein [Caudoviricetes sp.]